MSRAMVEWARPPRASSSSGTAFLEAGEVVLAQVEHRRPQDALVLVLNEEIEGRDDLVVYLKSAALRGDHLTIRIHSFSWTH